jgi:hypothetical protein
MDGMSPTTLREKILGDTPESCHYEVFDYLGVRNKKYQCVMYGVRRHYRGTVAVVANGYMNIGMACFRKTVLESMPINVQLGMKPVGSGK